MFNKKNKEPEYTNVSVEEFKALMADEQVRILDVRTKEETSAGIIPTAIIDLDYYNGQFEASIPSLDKSLKYLVYCRSGVRSVHACEILASAGFKHVFNLRGGIIAWNKQN